MLEEFQKIKNSLMSKPYIYNAHLKELEIFSKLLNKIIIDTNYKLDYIDYFLLGAKYFVMNDFNTALIYADIVIQIKPDFPRGYNLRALSLFALKRYNQAVESIDKAIELNPNIASFWNTKAVILAEMEFYKEALELEDKAIELDPNYFFALLSKAKILIKLKDYEKALEVLNKALSIEPNYLDAIITKVICLIELRKLDDAISLANEIILKDPNYHLAYYNRACAYALKGEKEKAIEDLKKAIELEPDNKFIAMDDKDFDSIRNTKEFKELIEND